MSVLSPSRCRFLLLFACLAFCTFLMSPAQAQYRMPEPLQSYTLTGYEAKSVSFSPDGRFISLTYIDFEEKEQIACFDLSTQKEVSPAQAGYPWTSKENSKYEFVYKHTDLEKELYIAEKASKKPVYGIDVCMNKRQAAAYALDANGQYLLIAWYEGIYGTMQDLYKTRKELLNRAAVVSVLSGYGSGEKDESKEEKFKKDKLEVEEAWEELKTYKNNIRLELLPIKELQPYQSYASPTLDKQILENRHGVKIFGSACYCGELLAVYKRLDENTYRYGYVNRAGELVVPVEYSSKNTEFKAGFLQLKEDEKTRLFNVHTGKEFKVPEGVVDILLDDFEYNDYATIDSKDGLIGLIDREGNIVMPCQYEDGGIDSKDNRFVFKKDKKYGVIAATDRVLIPFEYENLGDSFSEGLLKAQKDKRWGFINEKNEVVIPFSMSQFTKTSKTGKYLLQKTAKVLS